jgi:hypothetical protein
LPSVVAAVSDAAVNEETNGIVKQSGGQDCSKSKSSGKRRAFGNVDTNAAVKMEKKAKVQTSSANSTVGSTKQVDNSIKVPTANTAVNSTKQIHTNNSIKVPTNPTVNSIKLDIDPHTPWSTLWKTLRKSHGWKWQNGSGLMTDYYYIKPGKKIKGGMEGVDYFCSSAVLSRRVWLGWR